jgi:hemolysin III
MSVSMPLAKPRFRGRLHQFAFYFAIPQGIALVGAAAGLVGRIAAIIYALTLAGLYGVSAAYHRLKWSPRGLLRMRRLDHSMIFALIAGTYTPIALVAMHGVWRVVLLAGVWTGAASGIVMKNLGLERTRKITSTMYIVLGWLALLAAPAIVPQLDRLEISLIAAGGVLYTLGAIVLARHRPDPNPLVFGYHEVWHVMVVSASLCHYAAIMHLLTRR